MNEGQLVFDLGKVENFDPNDFFISKSNQQVSSLLNETNNWFNGSAVVYGKSKSCLLYTSELPTIVDV